MSCASPNGSANKGRDVLEPLSTSSSCPMWNTCGTLFIASVCVPVSSLVTTFVCWFSSSDSIVPCCSFGSTEEGAGDPFSSSFQKFF